MRARAASLQEVLAAVGALLLVLLTVLGAMKATGEGLSLVQARSSVSAEAERCVALMVSELRDASLEGAGGLQVLTSGLQAGPAADRVLYSRLEGLDLSPPPAPRWSDRRELAFQASPGEVPGNTIDDDRDGLVDEGRCVLVSQGGQVLLLDDVSGFAVELARGPAGGLPTLELTVVVEQPLAVLVRDAADVDRLRSGAGPRVRYVARALIPVLN